MTDSFVLLMLVSRVAITFGKSSFHYFPIKTLISCRLRLNYPPDLNLAQIDPYKRPPSNYRISYYIFNGGNYVVIYFFNTSTSRACLHFPSWPLQSSEDLTSQLVFFFCCPSRPTLEILLSIQIRESVVNELLNR